LEDSYKYALFFVVGTTATGKSQLAIEACEKLGAAIVNADSVQLYQQVDIGTAKPSLADQQRVPHHLFDIVEPGSQFTAGDYEKLARERVLELLKAQTVFMVGGSGFYLQAFEKGMMPAPKTPPEILQRLQQKLEAEGLESLHQDLERKDPEYATRVSVQDSYRVLRALSIMEAENRTMTEIAKQFESEQKLNRFPVPAVKVGLYLERDELRERVRSRLQQMVARGLKQEVEGLLQQGLKDWMPMTSVGYKQTVQLLEGDIDESDWLPLMETSTMQLAKRQRTWFQRDKSITWFHAVSERAMALDFVIKETALRSKK
jgi:tRNA dimethylallyltransferase